MSDLKTRSELRDLLHTRHAFEYPDFAAIEVYLEVLVPFAKEKGVIFNINNFEISQKLGGYLITPLTVASKIAKLAKNKLIKRKIISLTSSTFDHSECYTWQITILDNI
jgi:hypothetical protein